MEIEDAADQGCLGTEEGVLVCILNNDFDSHSVLLGGKLECGDGGGIEGGRACGDTVDEEFTTAQARVAEAEGCRTRFGAIVLAGAEEEK